MRVFPLRTQRADKSARWKNYRQIHISRERSNFRDCGRQGRCALECASVYRKLFAGKKWKKKRSEIGGKSWLKQLQRRAKIYLSFCLQECAAHLGARGAEFHSELRLHTEMKYISSFLSKSLRCYRPVASKRALNVVSTLISTKFPHNFIFYLNDLILDLHQNQSLFARVNLVWPAPRCLK